MTPKRLHIFLNALLQSCRENGTSAHESGITVSTEKRTGETIDVFHTDSDEGRKCLKMESSQSERISDFLYYYTIISEKNEIACLVELKGTKLKHASDQVKKTYQHLAGLLTQEIPSQYHQNFIWRICICLGGSHSPSVSQRIHDDLKKLFGKNNVEIRHGVTRHDIGPLLRRGIK